MDPAPVSAIAACLSALCALGAVVMGIVNSRSSRKITEQAEKYADSVKTMIDEHAKSLKRILDTHGFENA